MGWEVLYAVLFGALFILLIILSKTWWRMQSIAKEMAKQSIHCPPYSLIDGHDTEMNNMAKLALSKDMSSISHDIFSRIFPFYSKYSKIYGEPLLIWWKKQPVMFVNQPSMVAQVLNSNFGFYEKIPHMEFFFGKGVLMASGENWVRQRRIINVSLQQEKIKGLLEIVASCCDNLVQKWEGRIAENSSAEIEVHEEFTKANEDVIVKCLFGSQFEKGKQYFQLARELLSASKYHDFIPSFVPTKMSKILGQIDSCLLDIVEEYKENIGKGCQGNEILGSILEAGGEKLSSREVIEECKGLLIAGHETIAQHLTWTIMLLGLHQDWQEEAYQEVKSVFKGRDASNQEMLHKLKIMNMIINESLRLYPPAVYAAKQAMKNMQLGDEKPISIPKGLLIGINILRLHHDTSNWGPDVNMFNPRRFAQGVSKACKHPFGGYIPFLMGPRVCVGQAFALQEAKIFLSSLLLRFKWQLSPKYRHAPHLGMTLRPQYGVPIIITYRTPI